MLKFNARRFATLTLATAGVFTGTVAYGQTPGITQGDSQPAPRRSSPSTGDTVPELDSRTGQGEFARDVTTRGAAVGDDAHERTSFIGLVTGVAPGRITVKMSPPRVPTAMEQVFRVGDDASVIVGGEASSLDAVREGDTVRVITAAADPEIAVRLTVARTGGRRSADTADEGTDGEVRQPITSRPTVDPTLREADEDEDPNFDVYPENEQETPPPEMRGPDHRRRMAMQGGEEAVLPLGIEVFGGGNRGALVTEMLDGGPAATAGVLINDLVVAVNGQTLTDPELFEHMLTAGENASSELTILRNGETLQIPVQPGMLSEGSLVTANAMQESLLNAGFIGPGGVIGAGVVGGVVGGGIVGDGRVAGGEFLPFGGTFTDAPNGVGLRGNANDLLGGFLPGDVITGINGEPITNRAQLLDALNNLPTDGQGFVARVNRNGEAIDLDVPLSALGERFLNGQGFGVSGPQAGNVDGTTVPPNGLDNPLAPRSPGRSDAARGGFNRGRSDAARGGIGTGRSDASRGGIGLGRSQASPGNNRFGGPQRAGGTGTQSGAGVQNGTGTQGQTPNAGIQAPNAGAAAGGTGAAAGAAAGGNAGAASGGTGAPQ